MEIKNTYTFKKTERLCSKKVIDGLFLNGKSFFDFPIKTFYLIQETKELNPIKILISVPKKKLKSSVDRNLIKRRIRESYRLNKHALTKQFLDKEKSVSVAFVYVSNKIEDYKLIERKIILSLQRLRNEFN